MSISADQMEVEKLHYQRGTERASEHVFSNDSVWDSSIVFYCTDRFKFLEQSCYLSPLKYDGERY